MFRAQNPFPHQPVSAQLQATTSAVLPATKTIVVPLDGTPGAERALPIATALARRMNAELRLLQVNLVNPRASTSDLMLVDDGHELSFRLRSDGYLGELARHIASTQAVRVTTETIDGRRVVEALANECLRAAHLTVLARRPRSWLSRLWFGSTTESLLSRLRTPLLVVPPAAESPACDSPRIERILLPISERPAAQRVVPHALAVAGHACTEFSLLRVIPLWTLARSHRTGGGNTAGVGSIASKLRNEAWFRLSEVRRRLEGISRSVEARVVFDDLSPARSIVAHATSLRMDLVALTTRPHRVPRWLRSAVPEYVAMNSPVPVLLCPSF
jgi:nucleotide-binding universal stress UspA family protein